MDVINELLIVPYISNQQNLNQNLFYNIFSFFEMATWFYIFIKFFQTGRRDKINIFSIFAIALCVFFSVFEIYQTGFLKLHINSLRLFDLLIIFFSCRYLFLILFKDFHDLFLDCFFWISSACIIYHSVLFLNFTTMSKNLYWFFNDSEKVFYFLIDIGNVFYHILIMGAFLACYFQKKANDEIFP